MLTALLGQLLGREPKTPMRRYTDHTYTRPEVNDPFSAFSTATYAGWNSNAPFEQDLEDALDGFTYERIAQPSRTWNDIDRVAKAYLRGNENYTSGRLNRTATAAMERKANRLRLVTIALDDAYRSGADREEAKVWAHGMLIENGEDVTDRTLETYLNEYESASE